MKKLQFVLVGLVAIAFGLTACQNTTPTTPDSEPSLSAAQSNASANAMVGRTTIWADGELFRSVVAPATFKASSTPFDTLYTIPGPVGSFSDGVAHISDSKPGDQDYNGGRWHHLVLKEGVDASQYMNATSEEELDIDDFMATDMYFECPLLPIN